MLNIRVIESLKDVNAYNWEQWCIQSSNQIKRQNF